MNIKLFIICSFSAIQVHNKYVDGFKFNKIIKFNILSHTILHNKLEHTAIGQYEAHWSYIKK